jgi:hypothetical protein
MSEANLYLDKKKACQNCGCETFCFVTLSDCSECENNGIEDGEGGYLYRELKEGEERTEASNECNCLLGESHNNGCSFVVCSRCEHLCDQTPFFNY